MTEEQTTPIKGTVIVVIEGDDIIDRTHYAKSVIKAAFDSGSYKGSRNIYAGGLVTVNSKVYGRVK